MGGGGAQGWGRGLGCRGGAGNEGFRVGEGAQDWGSGSAEPVPGVGACGAPWPSPRSRACCCPLSGRSAVSSD